jgi:hypothetical protein
MSFLMCMWCMSVYVSPLGVKKEFSLKVSRGQTYTFIHRHTPKGVV